MSRHNFLKGKPTRYKKLVILSKTNGKCAYCGIDLTTKTLTLDHILPISENFDLNRKYDNILPSCFTCNSIKFIYKLEKFRLLLFNDKNMLFYFEKMKKFPHGNYEEMIKMYGDNEQITFNQLINRIRTNELNSEYDNKIIKQTI